MRIQIYKLSDLVAAMHDEAICKKLAPIVQSDPVTVKSIDFQIPKGVSIYKNQTYYSLKDYFLAFSPKQGTNLTLLNYTVNSALPFNSGSSTVLCGSDGIYYKKFSKININYFFNNF